MSTASSMSRRCVCFVIPFLVLAGSEAAASDRERQSGASIEPVVGPARLDDALVSSDVGARGSSYAIDVRDTAVAPEPVVGPQPLWERLESLGRDQRANAKIELEPGSTATGADRDAVAAIATLWNAQDYDAALAQLRVLEEAGASVGLGIAWTVPIPSLEHLMLDGRIGASRTDVQTMSVDYDAQSGHLFTVLRWGSTTGTGGWTVNISIDSGITWSESYAFSASAGIVDVDCAVVDDYVYVAYVASGAANEARLRRCLVSTGAVDTGYSFHVALNAGANTVEEVALASNADDNDNRIYYAIIQNNDVLRYAYDVATDGTTFEEDSPLSSNPEFGLDMTWDNGRSGCTEFLYVSYSGNDGNIHVLGHAETTWTDWTIEPGAGSSRRTAVSAFEDSIICAFEYPFASGTGIRYGISYDCGATWSPGSLAVPDGFSAFGYFEPDVDARNGAGTAIIYQAEAGEFDPLYYRTRAGFAPGPWSDPVLFNDHDGYTGSETAIGYIPPLAGEPFSHGALYLSLDPDHRTLYFDRPGASGPPCGDITPPVVTINQPGALECACDSVKITGSVGDPDGTYVRDRLEVRRSDTSAWVEVDAAIGARSGVLYTWDTTGFPQQYYYVRIVAGNECGLTASGSTFVYRSTGFDDLQWNAPVDGNVYGGAVCFDGTVWTQSCFAKYTVDYAPSGGRFWNPVDPAIPVYGSPIINGFLASWSPAALGLSDGKYDLRVIAATECGDTAGKSVSVVVDNTPPVATLDTPASCDVFIPGAAIEILGEVYDLNLQTWTLAVTGGPYDGWHTIQGPKTSNASGLLHTWDTTGLPACAYTIRLRVADKSEVDCGHGSHVVEDYATIVLGGLSGPDLDGDGDVDIVDFMLFQLEFSGPMP